MHKQRVLTALIIVPVVLSGLLWGGTIFFNSLVFLVASLCLYEYFSMTFEKQVFFQAGGIILGLIPAAACMFRPGGYLLVFSVFLLCLSAVIIFLITYKHHREPFLRMAVFLFGTVYVGLSSGLIALIHPMTYGKLWIIFLLVVVASADTGAYYMGSAIGKRKLSPHISKGKTIEGAMGGLAASAVAALICWIVFMRFEDPRILVPVAILLGITSQIGDLSESVIKRACGKKDSGRILPGHGGVFDRVDGLLLAGPVLFWILYFSEGYPDFR